MCGIAGYLNRTHETVDRDLLDSMVRAVAHRGPDGHSVYVNGAVGLGHRRLSIIDLSTDGAQPMHYDRSGLVIVYNGEIYNYIELRAELESAGYVFRTKTDTEVILASYDFWGSDCVRRFNGMWSFALFDEPRRTVFCSRDRFGVKPFYYVDDPRFLAFGSEIRQLLPLLRDRKADRQVLLDFLCFSIGEHGSQTFFSGVKRLPPAHNLTFRLDSGALEISRYYRLEPSAPGQDASAHAVSENLRSLFTDAVKLRLRSDVPVGTCLSGGLDSSSVAAVAAALNRERESGSFSAITAVSESPANDETAYARIVVDHAGLNWHRIKPTLSDLRAVLPDVVRAQEEPFGSLSVCMQFFVMREARRQRLPVLLDGQGGDETLLGYERYCVPYIRDVFHRRGARAALRAIRDFGRNNSKLRLGALLMFLVYFSAPGLRWLNYRRRMRGMQHFPTASYYRRTYGGRPSNLFDMQRRQVEEENIPHLLRYEDKNSMWHSVETRLPFLDYRFVEFALSLPAEAKMQDGWTKGCLRQAMTSILPEATVWRKNKMGFEAPDNLWLPELRAEMLASIRASALLQSVCGPSFKLNDLSNAAMWRLYTVALWEREFCVDGVTDG
jgi:asparagine synthase (glutamine-hydrolysing)